MPTGFLGQGWIGNLSLRNKLLLATVGISSLAIVLASISSSLYEWKVQRIEELQNLTVLAQILGDNSTAALSFNDPASAQSALGALRARRTVDLGCLYSQVEGGRLFAEYRRAGTDTRCPGNSSKAETLVGDGRSGQVATVPVMLGDDVLGYVMVRDTGEEVRQRLWAFASVSAVILGVCLLIAFTLANIMQRIISVPLLSLLQVTRHISENQDYSQRAPTFGDDELGQLIGGFNEMIARIEDAQRALRATTEQIRAIVETVPDGIVTVERDGTVRSFNPAAEAMFGIDAEAIVGRKIHQILGHNPESGGRFEGMIAALDGGGASTVAGELTGLRAGDQVFPVDVAIGEVRSSEQPLYTCALRDISDRKQAETRMQALNDRLREQIEERTRANEDLNEAIEKLQLTQDQLVQTEKMASLGGLVAGVAHEINTPIGVGVTAASTLRARAEALDEDFRSGALTQRKLSTFLEVVDQSSTILMSNLSRAAELIQSFKQVAIDQSSSEVREFKLREYIDEILLSLRPNIKKSRIQVVVDCDPVLTVMTYPGAFSQVLTNLVMNSLIHAFEPGDTGSITISVASPTDGEVTLCYADSGRGMTEDIQKKIFDPFFTTRRGRGGSGLGMHIVYNLVTQQLKGSIAVHSTPGVGSRFDIALPVDVRGAAETA